MIFKELRFFVFVTFVSARHIMPELKPGTYGFMLDGRVVKTWTPEEFYEWRSTNPLVELLVLAGYPFLRPGTQGGASSGNTPLGPTLVSQSSSSVGNGGSFASAEVKPQTPAVISNMSAHLYTTDPASTVTNVEMSTETADPSSPTETSTTFTTDKSSSPEDAFVDGETSTVTSSDNSDGKLTNPTTESILLAVSSTTKYTERELEKTEVSDKENEIDQDLSVAENVTLEEPSGDTLVKADSGRPANSRPGFSSATSASSASSQVHAEGSSLAESPGSEKGSSESNSNSASIVYGEFAGSVSISTSSASG